MVRFYFFLSCLCFVICRSLAADPVVEAAIDSSRSQANYPLEGTLTITHDKQEKIDEHSFEMEGKPLEVLFVKDVAFSAGASTLITIYNFQLPAKTKGLYVLPAISAKINDKVYTSIPSAYEVSGAEGRAPPASSIRRSSKTKGGDETKPILFQLEADVKGPKILYPGQRTYLFYRISYNRNIDLSHSEFPFIHPAHFRKIGDVQIRDSQQSNMTIQDLTQEVEASELGTFDLGPSIIEGYAYTLDSSGQKVYDPTLLHAEAPVVTLEVKPFPQVDRPPSFNGALGKIKVEATLESSSSLAVGDNLQLNVKLQGVTNLTDLHLPSLTCQPGFSGFFQSSDLPPLAEIDQTTKTKTFHVILRPLTTFTAEISPIQVSSFDPSTGDYVIQETAPIKLKVYSHATEKVPTQAKKLGPQYIPKPEQWPEPALSPLEFESPPIEINDLHTDWMDGTWMFWMVPMGLGLLLLQKRWHRQWLQRPKPQKIKSEELLERALKTRSNTFEAAHLLEEAFWWRLWEKGILPVGGHQMEKIPSEGFMGKMRSFLYELQVVQYSSNKACDLSKLLQQAKDLFREK